MSHLVCTSFITSSPLLALMAFSAAVETNSTVGSVLAERVTRRLPDNHDQLFAGPEDGGGIFAEIDAEAVRLDGGQFMATLSVSRAEINKEPGLLASFYGGSAAGAIRLFCNDDGFGGMAYWIEAKSAGPEETTHGPSQVLAWAQAAHRRISAANAVIDATRVRSRSASFQDEEEAVN